MDPSRQALLDLLELQKIDSRIDVLENRKRNLPEERERETVQQKLEEVEKTLGDRQGLLDDVIRRQKKLEGEIEMVTLKMASEEKKLHEVRSPRELSNLQAELESLQRRKGSMEDTDLEIMEEREALEKEIDALSSVLAQVRAQLDEATARRDRAASQIDDDLAAARTDRSEWGPKIESELLELYDDLRESKGGVAAAALMGGGCQGCHMQLPAQEVERLKKSEGLVRCVECRRILVVV